MKKIILLGFLLAVTVGVFAQKNGKEVIYLKSGTVLKGQSGRSG